ncbi:hypothetical protein J4E80_010657 [Alternaria sp. BMP 0032]|nr:hypothetical protein J4E80_010657 [Alternaria sp. BMP 0032]
MRPSSDREKFWKFKNAARVHYCSKVDGGRGVTGLNLRALRAARATGEASRGKVETVTRKDATRKRADEFDQKDSKTPGDPRIAVTDPRCHYST